MVVKQVVFKKLDIEKNTDAYISAIKKYKIDIVTHPNEHIQVNIKRLAEACAQNNCYLEINERHFRYQKQDIEECLKTNVKFIVSSDAHSIQQIDKLNKVFEKIKEFNIPLERIANFDKFPDFRNKYKTEKIENIKNNNQNRKQYIEENEL